MGRRTQTPMKDNRPNIVLFCAEDLDWEGVNCYNPCLTGMTGLRVAGNEHAQSQYSVQKALTPTIDGLARDGMFFTNYYCVSPVCTPSRYTMMTGRMSERSSQLLLAYPEGSQANIWFNTDISREETTLPKVLKEAGYHTCIVGKWHNFPEKLEIQMRELTDTNPPHADPNDPEIKERIDRAYRLGYDYLSEGFGWDVVDRLMTNNCEPVRPYPLNANNTDWIIEGATEFLGSRKGKSDPFFLYVAINSPHGRYSKQKLEGDPRGTRSGLLEKTPEVMPERADSFSRARAAGLDENVAEGVWLDDAVNAVQKKLRAIDADQNTIFVFTTDHPTLGKGSVHLGRMPLIMSWPSHIPEARVQEGLVSQADLAKTICELAGCSYPESFGMDGQSFAGVALGQDNAVTRESALIELTNSRAIVADGWKYIANRLPDQSEETKRAFNNVGWFALNKWSVYSYEDRGVHFKNDRWFPHYFEPDQLYELDNDPLEQRNVVADPKNGEVVERMKRLLQEQLCRLPHRFGEFDGAKRNH